MGLQAFIAVAQLGSLSKAAAQLFRTQGAVSRQIQQLEHYYEVVLFDRHSSGMSLSPEGERLKPIVMRTLSELSAFSSGSRSPQGTIRLRLPSTLALRWFLPRIDIIKQLINGIEIEISTSSRDAPNFIQTDIDAMLIRGRGEWNGLHSERIFPEHLTPMCSPSLALELGRPADMLNQCFIHADSSQQEWQVWWQRFGVGAMAGKHVIFDSLEAATSAAALGYGIALGDPRLSQSPLSRGELVMPFEKSCTHDLHYFLVMPEQSKTTPKLRLLAKALLALA